MCAFFVTFAMCAPFQLLTHNLFTCKWRWPRPLSGFQFNTWQIKWLRQAWGWITSLLWQIHISNRTRIIHILCMESKSSSLAITDKWAYTGIVATSSSSSTSVLSNISFLSSTSSHCLPMTPETPSDTSSGCMLYWGEQVSLLYDSSPLWKGPASFSTR